MPTEIFEDGIDLYVGLLESDAENGRPLPNLRPTGEFETRTYRTLIIENPFVRVTIVPALGGRILSLWDKRTSREILQLPNSIAPRLGGPRGVYVREGIRFCLLNEDRPNSLGNVACQIEDAADEDSPGGVWIAETSFNPGVGFHLYVSVPPDRAEVRVEARVHNRTLRRQAYNGGLAIDVGSGELLGTAFYSETRDAGLGVYSETAPLGSFRLEDGVLSVSRFERTRELAPRQVDTWSAVVTPYSGLGSLSGANSEVGLHMGTEALRVQTVSRRPNHKLHLLTRDGQTLEAPADLYPEHVLEIPLTGALSAPEALVLSDAARNEIISFGSQEAAPQANSDSNLDLWIRAFDAGDRHAAFTEMGIRALQGGALAAADLNFEQALNYNADDPLLWWEKALTRRLSQAEAPDELPELLNAHFLAPLEPALRAEAFLSQPLAMSKDASPLLANLDENPEEFVEVACLLVERGRLDQASRWIDEALRHRDLSMLRILMAYCLLEGTRLEAEAAEHLKAAERANRDPLPWRPIEFAALERVHRRFPENAFVLALIEGGQGSKAPSESGL